MTTTLRKIGALAVLTVGLGAAGAGTAHAADNSGTLSTTQLHHAAQAALTPQARSLLAGFVRGQARAEGRMAPASATAQARAATAVGQAIPVHELSPDFVRTGHGSPGVLGYVATTVQVGTERATVFTEPGAGSDWTAVNVASGTTEARMARRAHGASLLFEPQINGWYAVHGHSVIPLSSSAKAAIGHAISVAAYARRVHAQYADKLPGSAYDRKGLAGGYAMPIAKPAGTHNRTMPLSAAGAGAGMVLLGGGAWVRRRRASA